MLLPAGLLLHLLAFGTLVAPVFSLQFNFTSVQQCAPVLFSFSGLSSTVSRAPASLTIIPLNSTAIVIPLQNPIFSSGIGLNFLPLTDGSQFIASVDDVSGSNIINISDIMPVLPSPNNDSTCVPKPNGVQPKSFVLASSVVSQCQSFTINYNTTMVSQAPSVRLYSPNGPSFPLNATSDDPALGMATYTMAFSYGRGVVLLMTDGKGIEETTSLLTVGGDSSSPKACLSAHSTDTLSSSTSTGTSPSSFRVIAIVSATVGGVAVLLVICMAILILRDRRRRRRTHHIPFDKNLNEKDVIPQLIILDDPFPNGSVAHSVHTSSNFLSPKKGVYRNSSLASWSQAIPEDQLHPTSPDLDSAQSPAPADRLSAHILDVETMLNMTTIQPLNSKNSDPVVFGSPMIPQPALLQPPLVRSLSGRHFREPSDVPADMNSRTSAYSIISTNPFGDYSSVTVTESSSQQTSTTISSLSRGRSLNGRPVGLPSSPRDGPKVAIRRVASTRSNTNSEQWYGGIAR